MGCYHPVGNAPQEGNELKTHAAVKTCDKKADVKITYSEAKTTASILKKDQNVRMVKTNLYLFN